MNNKYNDGNYYLEYSLNSLRIRINPNYNNYSKNYIFELCYGASYEFLSVFLF